MCLNGVVKITDFGLAAFSFKRDDDPWTGEKPDGGLLCAQFEGGTFPYFSPEQRLIRTEWEKIEGEDARRVFKERGRLLTVPTSDLWQAAMTIVEMHALCLPKVGEGWSATPFDAATWCASRTLADDVRARSPEAAERWLEEKQILMMPKLSGKLKGKLVAEGVDGAKLVEWAEGDHKGRKAAQRALQLNLASAKDLHNAICRNISMPSNAMHHKIGELVCKSLAAGISERPATAADALKILGRLRHGEFKLPVAAETEAEQHDDETIARTFGDLAKRLVADEDFSGALEVCAEWLGVASSETGGRGRALDAYCNLWKRFGSRLPSCDLDLSRKSRGHWKPSMLDGGNEVIERLVQDLRHARVMSLLESIDFSGQELEGPVLELLLGVDEATLIAEVRLEAVDPVPKSVARTCFGIMNVLRCVRAARGGHARVTASEAASLAASGGQNDDHVLCKLHTLKLGGCRRLAPGPIPSAIGRLAMLRVLDLSKCQREGRLPKELGNLVNLKALWLNNNAFEGELPKELGNLINLKHFVASWNSLSGELPEELGKLANLTYFNVADNELQVSEEEKAAFEAKLPGCEFHF